MVDTSSKPLDSSLVEQYPTMEHNALISLLVLVKNISQSSSLFPSHPAHLPPHYSKVHIANVHTTSLETNGAMDILYKVDNIAIGLEQCVYSTSDKRYNVSKLFSIIKIL